MNNKRKMKKKTVMALKALIEVNTMIVGGWNNPTVTNR
jgi:hypothetical protein